MNSVEVTGVEGSSNVTVEIPKIVLKESNKEVPNKYRNTNFGSQMASGTSRCREIKKVIKRDDIKRNVQLAGSLLTFLSIICTVVDKLI